MRSITPKPFSQKIAAALLLSVSIPICSSLALASEPAQYQNDIVDLSANAYAVVIANVEKQNIKISETISDIRVTQSFKGPFKAGQRIQLKTLAGRVRVAADQPDLTGVRQAVIFLGPADQNTGLYTCFSDNYGFKPIINGHVYTNPQDPIHTVKLKKYLETLKNSAAQHKGG
jgi:hypothetical protein